MFDDGVDSDRWNVYGLGQPALRDAQFINDLCKVLTGWIGSGWSLRLNLVHDPPDQLLNRHHVSESFDGFVGGAFAFGHSNQ